MVRQNKQDCWLALAKAVIDVPQTKVRSVRPHFSTVYNMDFSHYFAGFTTALIIRDIKRQALLQARQELPATGWAKKVWRKRMKLYHVRWRL